MKNYFLIPNHWKLATFRDVCVVNQGLQIAITDRYREPSPDRKLYITVQYINTKSPEYTYYIQNARQSVTANENDILMTRTGNTGLVITGVNGVFHNNFFKIDFDKKKLNKDFLFYFLHLPRIQHLIATYAGTSTIPDLNHGDFYSLPILIPPLEEQKKIAEILSTWDEAIESQKRLLSLYQIKKEALVQNIYNDTEGLATVKIGDFLSESKIPGTNGELAKKLSVKLYGKGVVKKERNIPGSSQTKYFIRKKGQFIYSKLDFLNGAFGIIPNELDGYESTLDMPAFDIDMKIVDSLFFYYLVSREKFYKDFIGFGKGGRKAKRINQKDFLSMEIKIPSRVVQEKIGNFLRLQTYIIENHNHKYQLLVKQKKGLMQRLLTGKVRVNQYE